MALYAEGADAAHAAEAEATDAAAYEVIQQWQTVGPVAPAGLEDERFREARRIGITSFQSYVHWSEIEPEPGKTDFSHYDPLVAQLKKHGLKWVPFIIAGPYYSTPRWFRESPESVPTRCLEHDRDNVIQSIWNPALRARVEPYLKRLAEHYRDSGVLESVELGISGNWGESIFPAWGGFEWDEEFHTHKGMWCGEAPAVASFRAWLGARYESGEQLNASWGTQHQHVEAITTKAAHGGSDAARRDLMHWYQESMTAYAELWVAAARRHFPDHKIYLCTGGAGDPVLGADFAQQAKMCARYGAGLRITNQTDSYAQSYPGCRWLSTACRFHGAYLTTEPAGANSAVGIPMRVFDGMTLGADGLYFKKLLDNVFRGPYGRTDCADVFVQYHHLLQKTEPLIETAIFYPQQHFLLRPGDLHPFLKTCARLRDLVDLDMVDESLIADGVLERYRALVVMPLAPVPRLTQQAIDAWKARDAKRIVTVVRPTDLAATAASLRDHVRGDWIEDGVYHGWTRKGLAALNSHAEPVVDELGPSPVEIAPHAMALIAPPPQRDE